MSRLFRSTSSDRYQKLPMQRSAIVQRQQVLDALAREVKALRCEIMSASTNRGSRGRRFVNSVIERNEGWKDANTRNVERNHPGQRPPIVLTALDRQMLLALLDDVLTTMDRETACFLREEIERADIAPDDVAPNSVVRMGCEVKFVDHAKGRLRRAQLVFPEEAQSHHCISVLSPIGSALIGLGPGQSICWAEQGRERSLAVLEVRASERGSASMTRSLGSQTTSAGNHKRAVSPEQSRKYM